MGCLHVVFALVGLILIVLFIWALKAAIYGLVGAVIGGVIGAVAGGREGAELGVLAGFVIGVGWALLF